MQDRKEGFLTDRLASPVALCLVLVVLVSSVASEFALSSRNTLEQHQEWKLLTLGVPYPTTRASCSGKTRNLLHRNRLNLGTRPGYNEVLFYKPIRPSGLSCDIALDPGGLLTIWYAVESHQAEGIRLSRHPKKPAAHLARDREGKFVTYQPIPGLQLSEGWHRIELEYDRNSVSVRLDGVETASLPPLLDKDYAIGFCGEARNVMIDNVRLIGQNDELLFEENFKNKGYGMMWSYLTLSWLLSCLFIGVVVRAFGVPVRVIALRLTMLNLTLLLVLGLTYRVDFQVWSKLQSNDAPCRRTARVRANLIRLLGGWDSCSKISGQTLREFLKLPLAWKSREGVWVTSALHFPHKFFLEPFVDKSRSIGSDTLRLLLLGTSQTYGAGGVDQEKTLGPFLFERLSAETGQKVEIFDCSEKTQFEHLSPRRLQKLGSTIQPDYVIINLPADDQEDSEFYYWRIRRLVALTRVLGAQAILIQEANPESANKIQNNHEALARIAQAQSLTLIPLHERLRHLEDTGRLWHDEIHLTSYGQDLVANILVEAIIDNHSRNGASGGFRVR